MFLERKIDEKVRTTILSKAESLLVILLSAYLEFRHLRAQRFFTKEQINQLSQT